jgi:hypothetical protein
LQRQIKIHKFAGKKEKIAEWRRRRGVRQAANGTSFHLNCPLASPPGLCLHLMVRGTPKCLTIDPREHLKMSKLLCHTTKIWDIANSGASTSIW